MKINKKISKYNHDSRSSRTISYIVIHWVGSESTAKNNADYFAGGNRGASAHYFVDENSIWQSVEDRNIAWAVGSHGLLDQGSSYAKKGHKYWGKCFNSNSISIEMCCHKKNGKWYIADKTIENTADLTQYLMKKYNVPASHVIRHFDVNGKLCPLPYISEPTWRVLHSKLTDVQVAASNSKTVYLPKRGYFVVGDSGWKVKRLQSALNAHGANLKVDGIYGSATEKAVKEFQKKHGLTADGAFGSKSLKAL